MENNTEKVNPPAETTNVKCNSKGSDARTFWIALLTSVIVVALYHFGGGLYKIWAGECEDGNFFCRKTRCEYKVIPVMCPAMMRHCPMMMQSSCERAASFCKGRHPRRDKMAKRAMFRKQRERAAQAERRHHFRRRAERIAPPRKAEEAPAK